MKKVDSLVRKSDIDNDALTNNINVLNSGGMFSPMQQSVPSYLEVSCQDNQEQIYLKEIDSEAVLTDSIKPYDRLIKTAVLYNMYFGLERSPQVATLVFLCKDDKDNLFVLNRNYIIENKDDIEILKCLPFAEDKNTDFAGKLIANHMISTYLDSYITNFKFNTQKGFERSLDPILLLDGINIKNNKEVTLGVSAEVFACMTYIDRYIIEDITNDHDLQLATVVCSKESENPLQFFVVDILENIISMAPVYKKKNKLFARKEQISTVGLVIKVNRFLSKDEKESVSILVPLDVGEIYPDSKFKGKTIEDIQNKYYGESDQYVSTLLIPNIRIFGIDKEYMLIRGKNKDKVVKLFLLDTAIVEDLTNKIKEF